MKEKIIPKEGFTTTKWRGGETTQLAIYPEGSIFSEKDFLWRISSASFTSTESTFSDFNGYQRYILPLEGKLSLQHEGLYNRVLDKYEVESFDGSWTTFSKNSIDCIDYNLIVKSGNDAKMKVLRAGDEYHIEGAKKGEIQVSFFSVDDFAIELCNQSERREINGFSLYMIETEGKEKISIISADSPVIITVLEINN